MCLAADIPLIESGTAGYLGQVTVIKKVWFEHLMVKLNKLPITHKHTKAYHKKLITLKLSSLVDSFHFARDDFVNFF